VEEDARDRDVFVAECIRRWIQFMDIC